MRRRPFDLAALALPVVCVAAGGLWAWSHVMSTAGPMVAFGGGASGRTLRAVRVAEEPCRYAFIGLAPGRVLLIQRSSVISLNASNCGVFGWAVVGASLVLPVFALWRRLRDGRWRREGQCGTCGYDLHASPERCAECGAVGMPAPRTPYNRSTSSRASLPIE